MNVLIESGYFYLKTGKMEMIEEKKAWKEHRETAKKKEKNINNNNNSNKNRNNNNKNKNKNRNNNSSGIRQHISGKMSIKHHSTLYENL